MNKKELEHRVASQEEELFEQDEHIEDLQDENAYQARNDASRVNTGSVLIGGTLLVAAGVVGGVLLNRWLSARDYEAVNRTPIVAPVSTPIGSERLSAVITTTNVISRSGIVSNTGILSSTEVISKEVTSKEISSTMELAKPAAWDKAPVVKLVKASSVPSFPKTADEAAATFGVDGSTRDPKRWEKTPEGDGWHLSEAQIGDDTKDALNVNPQGYLTEGYYDTQPGRNPFAYVIVGINGNIPAQGATFWNEQRINQADKLANEMAIPKWRDDSGNVTTHPVTKIVPNQEQKTENNSTTLPKYPETADNAASLFGGKAENWEKNSDGGWHLIPAKDGIEYFINPNGRVVEGYNDDGLFVAGGKESVFALGATVWNDSGPEALAKLKDAVVKNSPGKTVKVID